MLKSSKAIEYQWGKSKKKNLFGIPLAFVRYLLAAHAMKGREMSGEWEERKKY